jgi:hypothetical protein
MNKPLIFEKDTDDPNRWIARGGHGACVGDIHRVEHRGWLIAYPAKVDGAHSVPGIVSFETFDAAREALQKAVR